jgi:hypothetical protein
MRVAEHSQQDALATWLWSGRLAERSQDLAGVVS